MLTRGGLGRRPIRVTRPGTVRRGVSGAPGTMMLAPIVTPTLVGSPTVFVEFGGIERVFDEAVDW